MATQVHTELRRLESSFAALADKARAGYWPLVFRGHRGGALLCHVVVAQNEGARVTRVLVFGSIYQGGHFSTGFLSHSHVNEGR